MNKIKFQTGVYILYSSEICEKLAKKYQYSRVSNNSLYHIIVQLGKILEKNKRP